jgi:hypothetical protein
MTAFPARRKESGGREQSRPPERHPSTMADPGRTSLRRVAATASMGVASAELVNLAAQSNLFFIERMGFMSVAALAGLAAFGLLRRSVLAQVISRAVAWVVLLPAATSLFAEATGGGRGVDWQALLLTASTGGALWLARPNLHADPAKREFAPIAYRRWFLAGAVAASTAAILATAAAAGQLIWGSLATAFPLAALAAALFSVTLGVVRMRSWGVLLGGATSAVTMAAVILSGGGETSIACATLAVLPALLLVGPILASRVLPPSPAASASATSAVRVSGAVPDASPEPPPAVRARVAVPDDVEPDAPRALRQQTM